MSSGDPKDPVDPAMRIVLLVDTYFPRTSGGIEVYTRQLAAALRTGGHDVTFACPSPDPRPRDEIVDGVPVHFYSMPDTLTAPELRLARAPRGFADFAAWLDSVSPHVLHAHYLSGPASVPHLEYAVSRGIATVLTLHFGTATCLRSTGGRDGSPMMRWGRTECDGELRTLRCSSCVLQARGAPRPFAIALALAEQAVASAVPDLDLRVGDTGALPIVVRRKRAALHRLYAALDALVVSASWQRDALLANGLDPSRIRRVMHGTEASGRAPRRVQGDDPVFGWAGRPIPEKGLEDLVEAFASVRSPGARLLVACAPSAARHEESPARLRARFASDPRIVWVPPFAPEEASAFYGAIDVFVAPYAMETGPLTVVEAFAHGVPVIGTGVGGIRELVVDGVNGRLFPFRDGGALRRALREALPREVRERWAGAARWDRSFADVAADYLAIYSESAAAAMRRGARPAGTAQKVS